MLRLQSLHSSLNSIPANFDNKVNAMGTNTKHIYITYLLPGRHVPTDDNNDHNDHKVGQMIMSS